RIEAVNGGGLTPTRRKIESVAAPAVTPFVRVIKRRIVQRSGAASLCRQAGPPSGGRRQVNLSRATGSPNLFISLGALRIRTKQHDFAADGPVSAAVFAEHSSHACRL